jgi:hypothetical protein
MPVEPVGPCPHQGSQPAGVDINDIMIDRSILTQGLDRNRVLPAFDQRVVLKDQNFEVNVIDSLEIQVARANRNEPEKVRYALRRQPFSLSLRKASPIDKDNPGKRPNHV